MATWHAGTDGRRSWIRFEPGITRDRWCVGNVHAAGVISGTATEAAGHGSSVPIGRLATTVRQYVTVAIALKLDNFTKMSPLCGYYTPIGHHVEAACESGGTQVISALRSTWNACR